MTRAKDINSKRYQQQKISTTTNTKNKRYQTKTDQQQ